MAKMKTMAAGFLSSVKYVKTMSLGNGDDEDDDSGTSRIRHRCTCSSHTQLQCILIFALVAPSAVFIELPVRRRACGGFWKSLPAICRSPASSKPQPIFRQEEDKTTEEEDERGDGGSSHRSCCMTS